MVLVRATFWSPGRKRRGEELFLVLKRVVIDCVTHWALVVYLRDCFCLLLLAIGVGFEVHCTGRVVVIVFLVCCVGALVLFSVAKGPRGWCVVQWVGAMYVVHIVAGLSVFVGGVDDECCGVLRAGEKERVYRLEDGSALVFDHVRYS